MKLGKLETNLIYRLVFEFISFTIEKKQTSIRLSQLTIKLLTINTTRRKYLKLKLLTCTDISYWCFALKYTDF